MLVLTRRKDERVVVHGPCVVTVVKIGDDTVRLGFDASPDVVIHRQEVQDAIDRDRQDKETK